MTTSVTILISGNKACEVKIGERETVVVQPGQHVTRCISGDDVLSVKETGPFVS